MLYVILVYNILVKLCPYVYPNMVVWSSESLQAAGKGNLQYHRLHRILIPHISVSFSECGVTVTLPSHVSPSHIERLLFHSEKGTGVVIKICIVASLKNPRGGYCGSYSSDLAKNSFTSSIYTVKMYKRRSRRVLEMWSATELQSQK